MTHFGRALRDHRLRRELSQGDIAAVMDLAQSNVAALELSRKLPTVRTIMRAADAYGISAVELFKAALKDAEPHHG